MADGHHHDLVHHHPETAKKIHESLRTCLKEGISASVMIAIVDYYLLPYALFMNASPQQIGFLVAIPQLFSSISQIFAVEALDLAGSRMKLVLRTIAVQAIVLLPVALLPVVPHGKVGLLIILMTLYKICGNIIGPAWGSLVSDYLPANQRGHYFGWRSQKLGLSGVFGIALWGVALYFMKKVNPGIIFSVLFLAAAAFRFLSMYFMSKMVDLPHEREKESDFTLYEFLKRFKESNFVKFVFYVAGITFAVQLASPYFSVYMLKELKFNYLHYTLIQLAGVVAGLISFPIWGRHADHVGNAKILKMTGFMVTLVPFLWLVSKDLSYLMAVEFFSGYMWGGFNLCAANFIYDAVRPQKRVRCLAYYNLIIGISVFCGASLGGFLAERLPATNGSRILTLFVISGALRLLMDLVLVKHFKEVRDSAAKVRSSELFFSVIGLKPIAGQGMPSAGDAAEWEAYPKVRKLHPHAGGRVVKPRVRFSSKSE